MRKTLLINQPGRHGDILICLPIAKWYSHAYKVFWLCPEEYHNDFKYINYCKPISYPLDNYDAVIDIGFGLNTDSDIHKWWIENRSEYQSFIVAKYKIAQIPLLKRWCLVWDKLNTREEDLYHEIIEQYGEEYIVVQDKTHDFQMEIDVKNKVPFSPIKDYNIFDWYKVLINAKEIHCIDSCLANFVEVLPALTNTPKYYYATSKVPNIWDRTLLINNWRFV